MKIIPAFSLLGGASMSGNLLGAGLLSAGLRRQRHDHACNKD